MPELPAPDRVWEEAVLPEGLQWVDVPIQDPTGRGARLFEKGITLFDFGTPTKYPRRLALLRDFAAAYGLVVERSAQGVVPVVGWGSVSVWVTFRLHPNTMRIGRSRRVHFEDTQCGCGEIVPVGTIKHTTCRAHLTCTWCGYATNSMIFEEGHYICRGCSRACLRCSAPCHPEWDHCLTCLPTRQRCTNCGVTGEDLEERGPNNQVYCGMCLDAFCSRCDERFHQDIYVDDYGYICETCDDQLRLGEFAGTSEEDDENAAETPSIPTIPGRELIRHCGIEIEGAGSVGHIIRSVRDAGLTSQREMNGYHHTTRRGGHEWSIESDATVDWELVSPKLNMADIEHVGQLNAAIRALRTSIREGTVNLDMRCGIHIHVAAAQVNIGHAYKLKGYWDYIEDVMFRLGAAKWPAHRAVGRNGYTRSTPKEGMRNQLDFARFYERGADHYHALSFANYFRAFLEGCVCGAVRYDTWDKCTCELGKCTFEFRVFNTSANPTKIHAYMALCQSLVAKATTGDDVDDIQAVLPPMSFEPIIFKKGTETQQRTLMHEWEPRLRWIFNELPLTDAEKHSVLYCAENSELANLGPEILGSLNPNQATLEVGI